MIYFMICFFLLMNMNGYRVEYLHFVPEIAQNIKNIVKDYNINLYTRHSCYLHCEQ